MPKLLLHICCGVCGVYVLEVLKKDFDVTAYFFNPNIYPPEEYQKRLEAVRQICREAQVPLVEGDYEHEKWLDFLTKSSDFDFTKEPEGGRRCNLCFEYRLENAGRLAKERGAAWLASTLTIGRNKRAAIINPLGQRAARKYGLQFYEADWKKQDGGLKANRLSKEKGIYRQHYCGCEFSQRPYKCKM